MSRHTPASAARNSPLAWASAPFAAGTRICLLQIEAEQTSLYQGCVGELPEQQSLPIGSRQLGQGPLRHTPPSPLELEQAIAAVEDLIMPLAHQVRTDAHLLLLAPALAPLAAASRGASPLTRVQIERYFQQLAAQAEGDPRATSLFKPTPEFAAALLIVREWMHHLGFERLEFASSAAELPSLYL